jgi:uncharacterized Rossmann fold enzyme
MAKITRELLGHHGRTTCYLVHADGDNIGRVIGERLNAKNTIWTAHTVNGREVWMGTTLGEGVKRLAAHHEREETP